MNFKIVAYIDQIYLNQKKGFIDFINKNVDKAILFTSEWEKCIVDQGLSVPTCYLPHGIDKYKYFPIDKKIARKFFNIPQDDFIILNLNRNQPRKRWDTCIKAFSEFISRHRGSNIKMVIGTAVQGGWNLIELFERELGKRGMKLEEGMKHIILLDKPQLMTDEETNILYNVADIGINTCDGEGFGLCNFEQAAIGIPQIVPRLGGFVEFFDDSCTNFVDPIMAYYIDTSRDAVGGEGLLCDYADFVKCLELYYENETLRKEHGQKCRENILTNFSWDIITDKLCSIIDSVHPKVQKIILPDSELVESEVFDSEVLDSEILDSKILEKSIGSSNIDSNVGNNSDLMEQIFNMQKQLNMLISQMNK